MSEIKPAVRSRGNEILKRLQDIKKPIMAEIGVEIGKLSSYLLEHRKDLMLYMVDNWLPESDQPEHYRATKDTSAQVSHKKQQKRKSEAYAVAKKYKQRAKIIETNSIKATEFVPGNLHLVFLDADHSYEGVKADIAAWHGNVRDGGWMGGHDYANTDPRFNFGVKQAVDEAFNHVQLGANFTWWVQL